MIRWEGQVILLIIGAAIITFLGILFYDAILPFAISPIHFFGFVILAIVSFSVLSVMIIKGFSPAFVSPLVHDTINDHEIKTMSWNNPLNEENEPEEVTIAPLGGINAAGIHPKSSTNSPIIICLKKYFGQIGKSYGSHGCLIPITKDMVPDEIYLFCEQVYGNRFLKCSGQIFIVLSSPTDNSNTVENQKVIYRFLKENKTTKYYKDELDNMMTLEEKKKKLNKKDDYQRIGVLQED